MPAQQINDMTLKAGTFLKAYYRFESGALTTDSSGNSNTLTNNNTVGTTTGYFGSGADFGATNTNKYLSVASPSLGNVVSFSFWIKPYTNLGTANVGIFDTNSAGNGAIRMYTNGGNLRYELGGEGAQSYAISDWTNQWHHIAWTMNGTAITLYVDGQRVAGYTSASNATYNQLDIGRFNGTNYASIILDDFAMYSITLSAEQVKEIYEGRTVGELYPQPNLVALYHLSGITDSSGNNRTLTNTNSVTFTDYGKFGKAANFGTANTNKSLYVANDLGITGGNITMSCWVKLNTEIASNIWDFVCQGDASTFVDYHIRYEYNSGTRRLRFDRTRRGSVTTNAYYTTTLGTTNWTHIVMTYDGTNIKGYVNGNFVTSASASGNGVSNTEDNFGIGADTATFVATGGSLFASATIDEVAVFSKALSDREIANYYQWAVGRFAKVI